MQQHASTARPRILVVEDEPLLLLAAMDLVEDAGFTPVPAASADAAIKIIEDENDIFLVFTDIDMPGSMDGLKLAAAVRHRWPPIHIIVVSGLVNVQPGDLPAPGEFFRKPYETGKVIDAMRRLAS